jgi:hypothetical protein
MSSNGSRACLHLLLLLLEAVCWVGACPEAHHPCCSCRWCVAKREGRQGAELSCAAQECCQLMGLQQTPPAPLAGLLCVLLFTLLLLFLYLLLLLL